MNIIIKLKSKWLTILLFSAPLILSNCIFDKPIVSPTQTNYLYAGNWGYDEIYIIELKPKAGMSAIGQALSLAELYREEAPIDKVVLPAIITDEEIPDAAALCKKLSVIYLVCS